MGVKAPDWIRSLIKIQSIIKRSLFFNPHFYPIWQLHTNFNSRFTPCENFTSISLRINFTRILTSVFTSKSLKFMKTIPESKSVIVSFAGMSKLSLGKVNLPQSWGRFLSSGCSQYGSSVTVTFEWVGFVITRTKLFSSDFYGFQISCFTMSQNC